MFVETILFGYPVFLEEIGLQAGDWIGLDAFRRGLRAVYSYGDLVLKFFSKQILFLFLRLVKLTSSPPF
jgi:hypothetical protein